MLEIFMTQTGLGPDELRARAADPHLLAGVLDFLLQSDSNVTQFADSAELKPEAVMAARRALPGGRDDAE